MRREPFSNLWPPMRRLLPMLSRKWGKSNLRRETTPEAERWFKLAGLDQTLDFDVLSAGSHNVLCPIRDTTG